MIRGRRFIVVIGFQGQSSHSFRSVSTVLSEIVAYDSHHPQSVKRGVVKYLYDCTKHLITRPSVISEEKKHLSSVLVANGYPYSFVQSITKNQETND